MGQHRLSDASGLQDWTHVSSEVSAVACIEQRKKQVDPANNVLMVRQMYPVHLRRHSAGLATPKGASEKIDTSLPPIAIGLALLEIYFSRVYNAPILFYKPLLFQEFLAEKLPGYLVRALYALATL